MTAPILVLLLAAPAAAYTPIAVDRGTDTRTINANFMELAQEVQRRDLVKGGSVRGKLDLSTTAAAGAFVTSGTFTAQGTFESKSSNTASGGLFGYYRGTTTWINAIAALPNNCCACAAGSSTTFVSDSGTTTITVAGAFHADAGAASQVMLSLLVDGLNPSGSGLTCVGAVEAAGQRIMAWGFIGNNEREAIYASRTITVAAGSHTFCMTVCGSSSGTTRVENQPYIEIKEGH